MNTSQRTMPALLTYEDYCQIPEDGNRYEVINGVLYMSPVPIPRHQRISGNLYVLLSLWIKEHKGGKVWAAPIDVVLSDQDIVQPDIIFISSDRLSMVKGKNVQGAPDLVIEIMSPSNRRDDEVVKKTLYESYGVFEYWAVDPVTETIQVFYLQGGRFVDGP